MSQKRTNKPLTLEKLKQMNGQPVWAHILEPTRGQKEGWAIVYKDNGYAAVQRWARDPLWYQDYGKTWVAYAYQPARIDREKWGPCEHCKPCANPFDIWGPHTFPIDGNEMYFYDTDYGWEGEEIKFCPWCGRPLTDEAWAELERRADL